jgi:hypothetical protein
MPRQCIDPFSCNHADLLEIPSGSALIAPIRNGDYFFEVPMSLLTVSEWRPLALLAESTLRPFLVAILALKPCLFLLFLLLG